MKQRVITAILGGGLFIAILAVGSVPFALLSAVIAVICYMELAAMDKLSLFSPEVLLGAVCVAAIVLATFFPSEDAFNLLLIKLLAVLMLLLIGATVFLKNRFHFQQAAYLLMSVFYIGFSYHLLVRARLGSFALSLFVLIIIWASDSGAYFIGRKWGRRKLAPEISPNKTKEGAAGALITALIVAVLFRLILREPIFPSWGLYLLVTLLISAFGQLGDLGESALKRHFGVKDSGKILPGHGGLLDRFDSLIFVLPILYLIGVIN
ncbi:MULTISPECIES: phosphatidate cytidylyltransferase [unclassified Sporolactobacillus]|uniref:phosphatidate cytidylyltransferase n=1 Tax=unclassified Sporolactobacillus TaxID=2628533 RepID=UPI002367F980|nr:phosphatidate cytidylyltransferase [Sporolactobacillus sp. CQH2019]MDD9147033.1 phosphatidate cytidylyltransferase [Sporolactobacillus sp. CQH2019]